MSELEKLELEEQKELQTDTRDARQLLIDTLLKVDDKLTEQEQEEYVSYVVSKHRKAMIEETLRIKCNICDSRFTDIDKFCSHAPLCDRIVRQAKKDVEKLKWQVVGQTKAI